MTAVNIGEHTPPHSLGDVRIGEQVSSEFTPKADLAARCHHAAIEGRWATTMRFFAGPTLLVIDELGYLPLPVAAMLDPLLNRSDATPASASPSANRVKNPPSSRVTPPPCTRTTARSAAPGSTKVAAKRRPSRAVKFNSRCLATA